MNRPICIGITGGIGSGKSMVCKIFNALGVLSYDADSRAKAILNTDEILKGQIRNEFGSHAYHEDGNLNRAHISKMVFGNAEKLAKINELVHPRVAADFLAWIEEHKAHPYLIKEAALLFETGAHKGLDKIILVSAPEPLRIKRVLARDPQRSESDVLKIIASQLPEVEKVKLADYMIANDESELVIQQVVRLHEKFSKL